MSSRADLTSAIRVGDLAAVDRLLSDDPGLATARVHGGRTGLHVVTDWPGYFPRGPVIAQRLLAAGADPNAVTTGTSAPETALHWAASTDDVDVALVLLNAGADLETPGGTIGTPLANAIGYSCWHVARLLVERGAIVAELWQAAALGRLDQVAAFVAAGPTEAELTAAFWQACSAGQRRAAAYLVEHGARLDGRPPYAAHSALSAAAGSDTRRELMVAWLRELGAR